MITIFLTKKKNKKIFSVLQMISLARKNVVKYFVHTELSREKKKELI